MREIYGYYNDVEITREYGFAVIMTPIAIDIEKEGVRGANYVIYMLDGMIKVCHIVEGKEHQILLASNFYIRSTNHY